MEIQRTPVLIFWVVLNIIGFLLVSGSSDGDQIFNIFFLQKNNWIFERPVIAGLVGFYPIQALAWVFNPATLLSLIINNFILYFLGTVIEILLGTVRFLLFMLFVSILSGFLTATFDPYAGIAVGVAVPIAAISVAYAFYLPNQRLTIILIPFFYFKAKHFVLAYFILTGLVVAIAREPVPFFSFPVFMGMASAVLFFVLVPKSKDTTVEAEDDE